MVDQFSDLQSLWQEVASLRAQVRLLSDREQIGSVIRTAARALDRLDRELFSRQFHSDAHVDYGSIYRGPVAGFVDVAMQFQGAMRDTQHLVGGIQIDVDGNEAAAESYVYAHHVLRQGDELRELIVGGRYLDRLTRREGVWRIAFRTEMLDWGRNVAITEPWFDDNAELPKGRRGRDDLSYEFIGRGRRR